MDWSIKDLPFSGVSGLYYGTVDSPSSMDCKRGTMGSEIHRHNLIDYDTWLLLQNGPP